MPIQKLQKLFSCSEDGLKLNNKKKIRRFIKVTVEVLGLGHEGLQVK